MKRTTLAGFMGVWGTTACLVMSSGACSSAAGTTSGGSGTSGTTSGAGGGNSSFSATSGTGFGDTPAPLPPAIPTQDAAPDAAFLCDALDQTKPLVLYLSADDSNSMGSPAYARSWLDMGSAPPKERIRTYEFLNYYRIDYPAPPPGKLSIVPQMENAEIPGELNLQIGVRAFDALKPRRPITVTFVLDTSGSMDGPAIEREREVAKAIVKSLELGDIVNMVTWNTSNNTILDGYKVSGTGDLAVLSAIDALEASGGTDLHGGLVAGYALAQQNYGPKRLNRVVLISDGGANVGITDKELIAANSKDADQEGIYLVGVGVGEVTSYNDLLMNVVTDEGRGAYLYVDSAAEAKRMFVDRFDETMEVAARSVQVEVTLPWYFKIEKFYGEEYSTDPKEIEPQHLAPGDAMIFSQVLKACDPSMVKPDDEIAVKVKWIVPLTYAPEETQVSMTVGQLLAAPDKTALAKGKAIVAYAEALKAGTSEALKDALALVQAANLAGTDAELTEIAKLLAKHPSF